MILFSHPTGNANVRHAALGLARAGLLGEFWTTVSHRRGGLADRLLPGSLAEQLRRRSYPAELSPFLKTRPSRELLRMLAGRLGPRSLTRHESGALCVDAIYHDLDRRVARRLADDDFSAVYAYEDGAFACFKAARQRGLPRLYDLPIGYWRAARRIMSEEAARNPEWAMTIPGNADSANKTARKDEELNEASLVLVASSFTRRTLSEAPGFKAPVVVIPYGAPSLTANPAPAPKRGHGPLRALYVGSLGQRKGLSYLFEACSRLSSSVELTVIGRKPAAACPALDAALARVTWIPSCPHAEVLAQMAAHDVFVFPSLFEGFGLVLLEAMAQGLPILTTAHTAGPDLLGPEGRGGFIVPVQSSEALEDKLSLLARDRELLAAMSEDARQRARDFTWQAYEQALALAVRPFLLGGGAPTQA